MVQMFLYVDLIIACRISLEIKQCLRDLVSSLAKTNPLSFCFVTQSLHGPQSENVYQSRRNRPQDQQHKAFVEETNHS